MLLCCAVLCCAVLRAVPHCAGTIPPGCWLSSPTQPQPVTSQPPLSLPRSFHLSLVCSLFLVFHGWFPSFLPSLPTQKISPPPQLPGHSPLRISPPSLPSAPLSLLRLLPSLLFPSSYIPLHHQLDSLDNHPASLRLCHPTRTNLRKGHPEPSTSFNIRNSAFP